MCQPTNQPTNQPWYIDRRYEHKYMVYPIPISLFNITFPLRIACTILNWTIYRTRKSHANLGHWYQLNSYIIKNGWTILKPRDRPTDRPIAFIYSPDSCIGFPYKDHQIYGDFLANILRLLPISLAFIANIFSFMLRDIGLKQSRSLTYKINLGNFTAEYKFFFLSVYGGYRAFVNF